MEGVVCSTQNEITGQRTWNECPNTPPSSEVFTPIGDATISAPVSDQWEQSSTEDRGLEDRKRAIWEEMRNRMENRRKEWNVEVDRMRKDFFGSKPADAGTPSIQKEPGKDNGKTLERLKSTVCDGGNKFRVCFDVSSFQPDEICVRTEEQKLVVNARHEDKSPDGKRTVTREFNRQVDIPRNVHPESMRCTLTRDGQLQVEADLDRRRLSAPASTTTGSYHKITPWAPSSPIVSPNTKTAESKMFTVSLNIGSDFEPEDLSVKTVDRKLVVSARRQVFRPGNTSMSEFHREFDLPDLVDPTTVTANMTEEGYLLIEAPLQSFGHQSIQQT